MWYLFGMALPCVTFLLFILVLRRKKESSKIVYDEMQTAVRGRAYKYATVTGFLAGIVASCLLDLDVLPMDGSFAMMTVSFLMVTVYIIYMVMKGVYFGISGNWKKWTLLICMIGLFNLITGVFRIAKDGLPEGKLTNINTTVMIGAMFLMIVAAVIIQKAREKRED